MTEPGGRFGSTSRVKWLTLLSVLMVAAAAFLLSACGDDDGSTTNSEAAGGQTSEGEASGEDGQAEAQASIEAAKELPEFTLKAPPVDLSKVAGKSMFNIEVSSAIPNAKENGELMQAIAEEAGVDYTEFQNQGQPTEWAKGIEEAITRNVDLIGLTYGVDPTLVIPQLKRAKSAGIPVLVSHIYEPDAEPPAEVRDLITATRDEPFGEAGELAIEYAVAEDGCDGVTALILGVPINPPSESMTPKTVDRFTELCPDSPEPEVAKIPVTEWGTKIQSEVESALRNNPEINWVIPNFDAMSIGAIAGIRAAGKAGSIKISTYNSTPEILKLIQEEDVVVADNGDGAGWPAHASMDQAFRILSGIEPIESGDEKIRMRVFDKSNVDETGTPPVPDKGYGESYIPGYRKLWGLE